MKLPLRPQSRLRRWPRRLAVTALAMLALTWLPVLIRRRALGLFLRAARAEGSEARAMETVLSIASRSPATSLGERRLSAAALRLVREARPSAGASLGARIDAAIAGAMLSSDRLLAAVAKGD